jgi:hypothetical protein
MHLSAPLSAALALLAASGATAMPTTDSPDVTVYDPRAVSDDGTSAATQLSKRSSIMTIKFHTSDDCVGSLGTYEVPDIRLSGCLPISISRPGRSVRYTIDNGYEYVLSGLQCCVVVGTGAGMIATAR